MTYATGDFFSLGGEVINWSPPHTEISLASRNALTHVFYCPSIKVEGLDSISSWSLGRSDLRISLINITKYQ